MKFPMTMPKLPFGKSGASGDATNGTLVTTGAKSADLEPTAGAETPAVAAGGGMMSKIAGMSGGIMSKMPSMGATIGGMALATAGGAALLPMASSMFTGGAAGGGAAGMPGATTGMPGASGGGGTVIGPDGMPVAAPTFAEQYGFADTGSANIAQPTSFLNQPQQPSGGMNGLGGLPMGGIMPF